MRKEEKKKYLIGFFIFIYPNHKLFEDGRRLFIKKEFQVPARGNIGETGEERSLLVKKKKEKLV